MRRHLRIVTENSTESVPGACGTTSRARQTLAVSVALASVIGACGDSESDEGSDDADTVPTGDEWLAYQETINGVQQIFVASTDGSERRPLAPGLGTGGDQTNPDWAPDGGRVVFAMSNGSTDDLWIADFDGSDAELALECVEPCIALDDPAWSPDGSSILFTRLAMDEAGTTGEGSLEELDLATGAVTMVVRAAEADFFAGARYSPDGTEVVLEVVHTDGTGVFEVVTGVELAVIDLSGESPTPSPITDAALFAATADWSPDGTTIVYSALPSAAASAPDLFSIEPDGSDLTRLTTLGDGGGSAEHPDHAERWKRGDPGG